MAPRFDLFAKVLADDVSRRTALRRLGAGFAALALGTVAASCETGSEPVVEVAGGPRRNVAAAGTSKCKCKGAGQVCFADTCTCPPGKQLCADTGACVDYCGSGEVLDATCTCVSYCGAGQSFCGGACVPSACSSSEVFNPATCQCESTCSSGQTDCSGTCRDLATDVNNCGSCGHACSPAPNATVACVAGVCTISSCVSGFGDCDGDAGNGCETFLAVDPRNCGACGRACGPTQSCVNFTCVATTGCTIAADCPVTYYCSTQAVCVPKQASGSPCSAGYECLSGTCSGGVCA